MIHKIIPGILETDWNDIEKKIEQVRPFADTVHIDVIDGVFAKTQTFLDPKPFSKYADELELEAHLMVDDPEKYLKPWADAGFKRFMGHVEKMRDVTNFVAEGQLFGEVGLAFDLDTELNSVKMNFEDLDSLLIMGVNAGASGQNLSDSVIEKIKKISNETFIPIEVDGGVNDQNITLLKDAGAERFITTHFLFKDEKPAEAYSLLYNLLEFR